MSDAIPRSSSLFGRTIVGLFWTGLGTGGQTLIQFVVLIVLARLLTPEDFGIVSAAILVVGLAQIFSMVGVGPAIVQRLHLGEKHIQTGFLLSLLLAGCFYGLVWLMAPLIEVFFRMEGLTELLRLVAIVFPIKGLGVVAESLLQRELRFKLLSGITLSSFALGYGLLSIILASLEFGPYALVWAYIGQACVFSVLVLVGRRHSVVPSFHLQSLRELLYFGSGYTIGRLGNYAAQQADNAVVGRIMDAASLGIYSRAYQLMNVPVAIMDGILSKVLFPAMSTIQEDKERLALAYRRGISATAMFIWPISAFIAIFSKPLVELVLGHQWLAVVLPLQILSFGLIFRTGCKISYAVAKAKGAVYQSAVRQWAYALSVVVFAILGAQRGLPGVAIGVTAAIFVNYILMAQLAVRLTGITWAEFALAHKPAFLMYLSILGLLLLDRLGLEDIFGGFIVMMGSLAIIPLIAVALLRLCPALFLDGDSRWLLRRLSSHSSVPRIIFGNLGNH